MAIVAGRLDKRPIGKRSKVGDTQVNAYLALYRWQGFWLLHLTGEHGVPLTCFVLDGTGFEGAFYRAMQLDLDGADFGEAHLLPGDR